MKLKSTEFPTPGQLKELFARIETGEITKEKLEVFLKKEFNPTTSKTKAQRIMGKNFFGIEDAIEHFGIKPTEEQVENLSKIPYSKKVLKDCRDTHVLVAILPISMLEIREKVGSKLFYEHDCYNNEEDFTKEKGKAEWKLIRKGPVPKSTSKKWEKQLSFIRKGEEVLTAQAMTYTIIGHYLKTGKRLFKDVYVRTSSGNSNGSHICIGNFGTSGFKIRNIWDFCHKSDIGIGVARKS
jgi:hypothetical protein